MTVRETLAFSARCQGVGSHYDMLAELSRREKEANIKPDPNIHIYMKAEANEGQEASVVTDYILKLSTMALVAKTVFLRTKMHRHSVDDGVVFLGALFFTLFTNMFNGMSEIAVIIVKLPVFYKQRDLLFYPFWVLFRQYLLLFVLTQMASALFRFFAGVDRNMTVANTFGNYILLLLFALSGFVLSRAFGNPQNVKSKEPESTEQGEQIGEGMHLTCRRRKSSTHRINIESRRMILPFEPHAITFDEITYSVDMPLEMKDQGILDNKLMLLKGVSGAFRPGVLTALMGVSGAGKTTLMDVLAGTVSKMISSPHVTVYESLLYSSWLRLSSEVNYDNRKAKISLFSFGTDADSKPGQYEEMFIEEVMELVELNPLRRALVRLPGVNDLSTEQHKWLTIAVEHVANPSIIFMDKPTSGIDARAAAIVTRTVRNTVDTGRTLFLMKRGGQEIYVGPLDRYSFHLNKYFEHNPPYTATRMFFTIATALTFGTMFWDLASKTKKQQNIFNAMGSMYAATMFLGVQNASSVQPIVDVERTVFYRERAAGMYSALSYAFAQVMVELPYAVTPNHHIATIVSTAFYGIWNLFSGFLIPRTRIPIWWRWYYWACPVAWTLYGLVVSQFGDVKDMLDNGKTVEDFARSYFRFKQDFLGVVAVVVAGFAVLFSFIFAFSIMVFNFQRR
ncbi:pleiotropic drug resistance protein 1 [Quercus suber]|uniref:Pleiotropic drug resistance protein 1 n=1 Tax=Quercus suber TaxID=58331 RepID=A0AAW0J6E1_QUESU